MLLLVSICKLVTEIALLALVGQWLLGLLAGARREHNLFYQLLQMATRPFVFATRKITPKLVIDRHVPLVTFFLLGFAWFLATAAKISICLEIGVQQCR